MVEIDSIKKFCEIETTEMYKIALTPYELDTIETAVRNYIYQLEADMEDYEWENTSYNKQKLKALKELAESLEEIPF